jgi:predicted ferric reductase
VDRLQTHPFTLAWWEGASPQSTVEAKTLNFLIEKRKGLTQKLIRRRSIGAVVLDGPYGVNLGLDNFEFVILVAQGIGIAGILPYIRHLSHRYFHENLEYQRGLTTRRIDIIWALEDNLQENWATEFILQLQSIDAERVCLSIKILKIY